MEEPTLTIQEVVDFKDMTVFRLKKIMRLLPDWEIMTDWKNKTFYFFTRNNEV